MIKWVGATVGAAVILAATIGGSVAVAEGQATYSSQPSSDSTQTPTPEPTRSLSDGFVNDASVNGGQKQGISYGFDSKGNLVFNLAVSCTGNESFVAGGPGLSNFAGYRGISQPQTFSGNFCHTPSGMIASNSIFIDADYHVCAGVSEVWVQIIGTDYAGMYKIPVVDTPNKVCPHAGYEPYFTRGTVQTEQYQPGAGPSTPVSTKEEPPKQVYLPGPLLPDSTPTPTPTPMGQ